MNTHIVSTENIQTIETNKEKLHRKEILVKLTLISLRHEFARPVPF